MLIPSFPYRLALGRFAVKGGTSRLDASVIGDLQELGLRRSAPGVAIMTDFRLGARSPP